MPYTGSGSFVLAQAAFVPGTPISSSAMNSDLSDIAQNGLTDAVAKDGQTTITGPFKGASGTVSLPMYSFSADLDCGMYRIGANNLGIGVNAAKVLDISTSGLDVTGALTVNGSPIVVPTNQNIPEITNCTVAESHAASAVTFAIKTVAGTDPTISDTVVIPFRNSTAGTGNYVYRTLTAALSFTISSGSTMGFSNATPGRIWLVLFDDAGTVRLGAINCLNGINIYPLGGFPIASSTAEGGAGGADSAHVFYTGTAVTSKAYYVLGYASYETGLTTAGTWAASPTRMQLFMPGVPLPGSEIQVVKNIISAVTSGATIIPVDATKPQNTEGTEFITQAIIPSSACNLLNIWHKATYLTDSTVGGTAAIFQDSAADALSAAFVSLLSVAGEVSIDFSMRAGTSSSTTFKIRSGPSSAATMTINFVTFGGINNAVLGIEEVMA